MRGRLRSGLFGMDLRLQAQACSGGVAVLKRRGHSRHARPDISATNTGHSRHARHARKHWGEKDAPPKCDSCLRVIAQLLKKKEKAPYLVYTLTSKDTRSGLPPNLVNGKNLGAAELLYGLVSGRKQRRRRRRSVYTTLVVS